MGTEQNGQHPDGVRYNGDEVIDDLATQVGRLAAENAILRSAITGLRGELAKAGAKATEKA